MEIVFISDTLPVKRLFLVYYHIFYIFIVSMYHLATEVHKIFGIIEFIFFYVRDVTKSDHGVLQGSFRSPHNNKSLSEDCSRTGGPSAMLCQVQWRLLYFQPLRLDLEA